ncbi:MAG: hypothetical protein KF866_02825 [Phycisphaeraceae bacterium]|nr:hypothetical protein [Phycisphaeraceae bacterium]MCW5753371.1 hypothetical protein [Phycisphaeraceae bacterium]
MKSRHAAIAMLLGLAGLAQAQVIINEVYENPPGSIDERYEYIELYGIPGTDLTGFAIVLIKGGSDIDGDGIPEAVPEIDEAFSLDGIVIGPSGLVVLWNDTAGASISLIPGLVTDPGVVLRSFNETHIPSGDVAGKLANDDSSTYVLVRKRPPAPNDPFGTAWRKDINPDPFFTGQLTFGDPFQPGTMPLQPYQMVDDVAWSNNSGKEYTRSSQQEISDTPGFNPDGISRLYYYGSNPQHGWRFNSSGQLRNTRMADEEWVYGDMVGASNPLKFDPARSKGPTDLNAPGYDGSCNPDAEPNCQPTGGPYLFTDINLSNFFMTPGALNDSGGYQQHRFIRGDVNFDQQVTYYEDYRAAHAHLQARFFDATPDLDETELRVHDNGTPDDPSDDFTYTAWKFEGRAFNSVMAMMNLDPLDGPGGTNATSVTPQDIKALSLLVCMADLSGSSDPSDPAYGVPDGVIDAADFFYFLDRFAAGDLEVDFSSSSDPADAGYGAPDHALDAADFFYYLDRFTEGCN